MEKVKRLERGWPGHYVCANRCRFRRNTLLSYKNTEVVVSTVGLMEKYNRDTFDISGFDTIGCNRYYETMCFLAKKSDTRYKDIDVEKQIYFDSQWSISELDADDKANEMHEVVVDEITKKLLSGIINAG